MSLLSYIQNTRIYQFARKYAYQGYNALVAIAVLYQWKNDAAAKTWEYIPDIVIHAHEAILPNSNNEIAFAANVFRAVQALGSFLTGKALFIGPTSIPTLFNGLDFTPNHVLNLYKRGQNLIHSYFPEEKASSLKMYKHM